MNDNKEKRVSRVREMKNDLILDAALEVFAEKGFHDTRLEDIAQAAGFSKASLYNYYKDKEMIFLSLGIREFTKMKERLENDPLLHLDKTLPIKENLRRILTLVFTTMGDHFAFLLTLNSFQFLSLFHHIESMKKEPRENIEKDFMDIRCELEHNFVEYIADAQKRGEINSPLPAEQLHTYFDAIIFGTIREWYRLGEMGDIPKVVDEIVEFLAQGFGMK